jgi:hypothetical protein
MGYGGHATENSVSGRDEDDTEDGPADDEQAVDRDHRTHRAKRERTKVADDRTRESDAGSVRVHRMECQRIGGCHWPVTSVTAVVRDMRTTIAMVITVNVGSSRWASFTNRNTKE